MMMSTSITVRALLCVSLLCASWLATAEENSTFNLLLENDNVAGTDRNYTNGLELSFLSTPKALDDREDLPMVSRVGANLPRIGTADSVRYGIALGQQIFTPEDTDTTAPLPDQRPYAGWLYLGFSVLSQRDDALDAWVLNVGIVGPAARGEQVQNEFHRLIGSDLTRGWRNQLRDEPGLQVIYDRLWKNLLTPESNMAGFGIDLRPHLGFSLGNIATYVGGGLTFRIGTGLDGDFGAPRIRPSLPGSGYFQPSTGRTTWYLFSGIDARAIARNIFLDGNSFKDSLSVDKKSAVIDTQTGVAIVRNRMRLTYTYVLRSREFNGQPRPDRFGSVSLSVRFD